MELVYSSVAGETRLEHATLGFGDRCSTIEPLPFNQTIAIINNLPALVNRRA